MTARIIRPLHGRIEVHELRGPRGNEGPNRQMFRDAAGELIRPTWESAPDGRPGYEGFWTLSRAHLTDVAEAIAIRDGSVLVEMHYSDREQCDARCQRARGDDCTCSCEGKYHGDGLQASWTAVGDTVLVRSTGLKVVTRELTAKRALKEQAKRS